MKGILATICAFALMGSVISETFPNDLFYHHHPDLAVADANSQGYNRYAQPNGNPRANYRQAPPPPPPPRNAYSNGPRYADANYGRSPNRANYGHESINRGPQTLTYNEDGSINWSKTKKTKVAAADAPGQKQQQDQNSNYNDYYTAGNGNYNGGQQSQQQDSSPNPYGNQGNSPLSGNDQQSSRQFSDDNYYGNQNSGGNSNNNYYRNNYNSNGGSNSNYNNDGYSSNGHYGNSNGNNEYYSNGNDNDNGYYDGGNNYNNNNGNYGNNDNGYYNNDNYNNNNNNAGTAPDFSKNASRFAAGGLRLAGALPDDGYTRGEGTFYDLETHIGTCGKQNKNTELAAALNSEQMGDSSRNNPNCGREVEIVGPTGKTVQVTIVDNCKTCKANGLDLSPAAFEELGDFSHGSVPIKWKFI